MTNIKISVIIPVYNVEKYLAQCLDSVINQTLKELEIICVNDGSTDKSRKILSKYAEKDKRIIIIDQKNQGLSAARNTGMRIAKGEYLGFVDSDDWIDETMYEKLYANAKKFDSEMAIVGVHKFDETKQKVVDDDPYFTLGYFDNSLDNIAFNHYQTKDFLFEFCVMAWNKIYKRDFIEKYNAKFPYGLIFEDGPFFHQIYYKMERVSLVRENLYYYRVNRKNSIVQKGENFVDIFDVMEMIFNEVKDLPYFDEIKYEFFKKRFDDTEYRFSIAAPKYKKKYFYRFKNFPIFRDEKYFDPKVIDEKYPYVYELFEKLKNSSFLDYKTKYIQERILNRIKYKIMQILYYRENYYTLKCYKLFIFLKKRPKIFDMWYREDYLYFSILRKIKFNIKFNYSKLEKYQNDKNKNINNNSV